MTKIGYAYYDDDSGKQARIVCCDCDDGEAPDGMGRAKISDSPAYGREVPYPECSECGKVMRPWMDARKKPLMVEAKGPFYDPAHVDTLEGNFEIDEDYVHEHEGYYLIRGVNDELYPCGADIFEKSYEVVYDE